VRRVQIVVHYKGIDLPSYFQVVSNQGWRLDCQHRELIIGSGMGRIHVPLDNVLYYSPEEYDAE
jgi:hypothetical protein